MPYIYISQYHGIEWYRPYDTNDWCIVQTDIVKPISIQCVTMRFLNWWYIYNVNHHSLPSEKHRILRFCGYSLRSKSFRPEDKPYSRCLLRTEWPDEFEECASTISPHNCPKSGPNRKPYNVAIRNGLLTIIPDSNIPMKSLQFNKINSSQLWLLNKMFTLTIDFTLLASGN